MELDQALFQENERLTPSGDERQYLDVGSLSCELGGILPSVTVAYETWGTLTAAKDNAILICHALSGDSHAIGWWDRLIGPGKPIDTDQYFVIGTNALGGCQGTTGPSSLSENGNTYGRDFPRVTVGDMMEVQHRLVESMGISRLHAIAGGSMGGMQALEYTVRFPHDIKKAWITASCARHSAMQIGFNETARQAIIRDPKWLDGSYDPSDPPTGGLAVARMVGHLSYLSEDSFDRKFGRKIQSGTEDQFEVESYLSYQGDKFTHRFDANSLIVLSKAIDLYDCPSLERSETEYLFTSFTSDWLYPSHQSKELLLMAKATNRPAVWHDIDLPFGHDAFLLDGQIQGQFVRNFLA